MTTTPVSNLLLRTQSDARLAQLAADGHGAAFTMLVDRHWGLLHVVAARVVGRANIEDVTQEAVARAWRALLGGAVVEEPRAWLTAIVRNSAYEFRGRDAALHGPPSPELVDPRWAEGSVESRREVRELLESIAELPEPQRKALVGSELDGASRSELAEELGVSEGAVRQLVFRARSRLRVGLTALTPYPLAVFFAREASNMAGVTSAGGAATAGGAAAAGGGALSGSGSGLAGGSGLAAGLLSKGGATLVAAGALGGGTAVMLHHPHANSARPKQLTQTAGGTPAPAARAVVTSAEAPGRVLRPARDGRIVSGQEVTKRSSRQSSQPEPGVHPRSNAGVQQHAAGHRPPHARASKPAHNAVIKPAHH
ncbi:MAG: sigma-70 family RNA polymerase sigma factor, partial [Solirubrobacterales bacterium]|nr:sigma-70 family RNA polymerase sigma factor [Solirubrobacterales bacterium]